MADPTSPASTEGAPAPSVLADAPVPAALPQPAPKPTLVEALFPDGVTPEGKPQGPDAPAPAEPVVDAEAKSAEPAPTEEKPAEDAKPPEPAAPLTVESYADLALPEGLAVSPELFTEAKTLFAEQGIDPAKAPALLDLFHKALIGQTKFLADAQTAFTAQHDGWVKDLAAMPEFQGERRAQSDAVLGRAFEEFVPAQYQAGLRDQLRASGLGNHPGLVAMLLSMSSALVEDGPMLTGAARSLGPNGADPRRDKSLGQQLYPDQPST